MGFFFTEKDYFLAGAAGFASALGAGLAASGFFTSAFLGASAANAVIANAVAIKVIFYFLSIMFIINNHNELTSQSSSANLLK